MKSVFSVRQAALAIVVLLSISNAHANESCVEAFAYEIAFATARPVETYRLGNLGRFRFIRRYREKQLSDLLTDIVEKAAGALPEASRAMIPLSMEPKDPKITAIMRVMRGALEVLGAIRRDSRQSQERSWRLTKLRQDLEVVVERIRAGDTTATEVKIKVKEAEAVVAAVHALENLSLKAAKAALDMERASDVKPTLKIAKEIAEQMDEAIAVINKYGFEAQGFLKILELMSRPEQELRFCDVSLVGENLGNVDTLIRQRRALTHNRDLIPSDIEASNALNVLGGIQKHHFVQADGVTVLIRRVGSQDVTNIERINHFVSHRFTRHSNWREFSGYLFYLTSSPIMVAVTKPIVWYLTGHAWFLERSADKLKEASDETAKKLAEESAKKKRAIAERIRSFQPDWSIMHQYSSHIDTLCYDVRGRGLKDDALVTRIAGSLTEVPDQGRFLVSLARTDKGRRVIDDAIAYLEKLHAADPNEKPIELNTAQIEDAAERGTTDVEIAISGAPVEDKKEATPVQYRTPSKYPGLLKKLMIARLAGAKKDDLPTSVHQLAGRYAKMIVDTGVLWTMLCLEVGYINDSFYCPQTQAANWVIATTPAAARAALDTTLNVASFGWDSIISPAAWTAFLEMYRVHKLARQSADGEVLSPAQAFSPEFLRSLQEIKIPEKPE